MQREVSRNLLTEARTNWLELVGRLRTGQRSDTAADALNRQFQELGLGLLGSFGLTQMMGTLVFGVTTGDAATFAATAAVLALVSLIACAMPVHAATRVDALAAIRHE